MLRNAFFLEEEKVTKNYLTSDGCFSMAYDPFLQIYHNVHSLIFFVKVDNSLMPVLILGQLNELALQYFYVPHPLLPDNVINNPSSKISGAVILIVSAAFLLMRHLSIKWKLHLLEK